MDIQDVVPGGELRLEILDIAFLGDGAGGGQHAAAEHVVEGTGFDGSPEASLVVPSLTTVSIQSTEIGRLSADVLNNRILNPDRPYRRIFVVSTPVFAESTERG